MVPNWTLNLLEYLCSKLLVLEWYVTVFVFVDVRFYGMIYGFVVSIHQVLE